VKDVAELTIDELREAVAVALFGWSIDRHGDLASVISPPPANGVDDDDRSGEYIVKDGWLDDIGIPDYPRDIAAAFSVVEKMHGEGAAFSMTYMRGIFIPDAHKYGWSVGAVGIGKFPHMWMYGESLPETICRVAIKAVRAAGGAK
jgi:hypothetical protein